MECIFPALLTLLALSRVSHQTRIRGSWKYDPGNRLEYLTKFGVRERHQVFVYGTAEQTGASHVGFDDRLALAFVPSATWKHFYDSESKTRHACNEFMYGPFNDSLSPDSRCSGGTEDLYRVVPCDYQRECNNQHVPPVPGSKFTFRPTATESQFYYLFIVGCNRNANASRPCEWYASQGISIEYDIHLVNQDPALVPEPDPFVNEFSYELIGMMVIYILFSCIYFSLTFFHLLMHSCVCTPPNYKHHRLTVLFSVSLVLETLHVLFVMTHYCVFSVDGVGVKPLFYIGQALNFLSDWLLILVLILIGKGWQITTATVRWKKVTLVVWFLYIIVSGIFFVWIVVSYNLSSSSERRAHFSSSHH